MRRLQAETDGPPLLDDVHFKQLYRKETYDAVTRDGWTLQITRYRPVPQSWVQPLLDVPLLLVPGWSQNRHAFTCGKFVKQLLFYGADVHILELRGHGKSSRELQLERARETGRLPKDLDWDWDLDSYLLEDVPAAVDAVRKRTGRDKIVYIGNSMGGMLGYGYAAQNADKLLGLVALGAPSDLGKGFLFLRSAALFGPALLHPAIDMLCTAASGVELLRHGTAQALRKLRWLRRAADRVHTGEARDIRYSNVPMDAALRLLSNAVTPDNLRRFDRIAKAVGSLLNPSRVTADDFRWLLRQGGEKEPRKVVEQFARWIRNDEMKCYRTGFDYRAHFKDLTVPLAIIYGDLDRIASRQSTRSIYQQARSEYLLWRPVKDNSHLELTMGYDIHQVCDDVRNLVEFALRRESQKKARAS